MRSTAVVMTRALQTKDDRIRKRVSYSVWKQMAEFLDSKPVVPEILRYFHNHLDTNHMYGTEQQAMWSEESLELAIRDRAIKGGS